MPGPHSYDVHRLRFGDWMPSAIKSLAADPFSNMIAIGRLDGDIEVSCAEKAFPVIANHH